MELVRPPRLRRGDTVAAVTLSFAGPAVHPHRYQAGKRQLEERFDLRVVEMPHTLADPVFLASHPEARADDLLAAFKDPSIQGIVSTLGGDDSIRILPHLDLSVIADNPKVVVGYSDTTVTHLACTRAGLGSFYGPAIMAGFGESGGVPGYLAEGVRRMLFTPTPPGRWPENQAGWTNELLDWDDPANQERRRRLHVPTGWRWLGGETVGEGPLVAGCLEVLDWLRGTAWWPDLDGAVLAVETSEECPPPSVVGRFFRSLAASGQLARLNAVLVGRPGGFDLPVELHEDHDLAIGQVVYGEEGLTDMPVVTGMDFGHTDPMWTLPIGATVRVDPATREVSFLTAGVC